MTTDSSRQPRRPLMAAEVIRQDFSELVFASSHGAINSNLGAGALYYALVHMNCAQVAVCIGSGGGFVPALLRRAQIDSAIEPSATYLVDANLPDLGFGSPVQLRGWMTDENPFRTRESDVVVLPMLSVDAARLFASSGVKIDYLHIDGDHSRDGMLADFRAYAPLLSARAVVTAHDVSMPGIREALSRISLEFPQWGFVTFPEIGAGTAVLRRHLTGVDAARRPAGVDAVDKTRDVNLRPERFAGEIAESGIRAKYDRWSYLRTKAFGLRYRIILDEVDQADCALVEIGGYPNSIADLAKNASAIHLVEPFQPRHFVDRVESRSRELGIPLILHSGTLGSLPLDAASFGSFNLVALGFDLSAEADAAAMELAMARFARLLTLARRSAIEVPKYPPSEVVWQCLEELLKPRFSMDVQIDLSRDPVADSFYVKDDRARRRVMVIEKVETIDLDSAHVRSALREAAARSVTLRDRGRTPVAPSDYLMGTPILFEIGGNSAPFMRGGWAGGQAKRYHWTVGGESVLAMRVDEDALAADDVFELELDVEPLTVAGVLDAQRLEVAVNGHIIQKLTLAAGRHVVKCELSRSILVSRNYVEMLFRTPDSAQPAKLLPTSKDLKFLGVRVSSVVLRAALRTS